MPPLPIYWKNIYIPFAFKAAALLAASSRPHGMSTLIGLISGRLTATWRTLGIYPYSLLLFLLFSPVMPDRVIL
ncbi:hypothetical protein Rin_00011870 [Candidatus Regiella insecticola 5.15]|uniref:Uncharacterized protein n=1 Tax=Candidatus Regiella insecticola 5.15 TaxID=1005043 RepID=G2GZH0_9ENTR|nr:hypothetical protein Rin_00011870 [Candidatus Regiella insecticola 5.15]